MAKLWILIRHSLGVAVGIGMGMGMREKIPVGIPIEILWELESRPHCNPAGACGKIAIKCYKAAYDCVFIFIVIKTMDIRGSLNMF